MKLLRLLETSISRCGLNDYNKPKLQIKKKRHLRLMRTLCTKKKKKKKKKKSPIIASDRKRIMDTRSQVVIKSNTY